MWRLLAEDRPLWVALRRSGSRVWLMAAAHGPARLARVARLAWKRVRRAVARLVRRRAP
jgi:hypothetical protein